jgi:hypothetical protein
MKNSAWYNKLWRKKLGNYPLKENADDSWAQMHSLLDEHLPVNEPSTDKKTGKFFGSTVVSMLGFILPAAAMIGALTYVAVKQPFKNNGHNKHNHTIAKKSKSIVAVDSLYKNLDTLNADSAPDINKENLAAANTNQISAIKLATGQRFNNPILFSNNLIQRDNKTAYNSSSPNGTTKPGSLNLIQPPLIKPDTAAGDIAAANNSNEAGKGLLDQIRNEAEKGKEILTKPSVTPGIAGGAEKPVKDNHITMLKDKAGKKIKASGATKIKMPKIKAPKLSTGTSPFDFSISAALNAGKPGSNMVFGLAGIYALNSKWLLNVGIKMDLNRPLSNTFTHPSYYRPDTPFTINDSRKLNIITVPVTLEYQVSDIISINAGPQISFSGRQSNLNTKLGTISDRRDTLFRTHTIDSALRFNNINKINVGISGGISIHLNRFYIDGTYQQNLTPYRVTTGLGGYKQYYHSFQIGLRYKFKVKRP